MKEKINGLPREEFFVSGHRACAGCAEPLAIRYALKASGKNTIVVNATGCSEVFSTPYPQTSWKVPWVHGAFENAASIASGINRALKMQGKRDKINIIVFGGDGATFDIGFQWISGAFERKERFLYICLDNEAYMNTGIQRSGSTDKFASTTTSPAGKKVHGKQEYKKPLPTIFAAHGVYVATANVAYPQDYFKKVEKALGIDGPSYIQVFTPCATGWRYPSNLTIEIAKIAFETKVAPLYEIENGVLAFSKKPSEPKPVTEYLKMQGRFSHMTPQEIEEYQRMVHEEWNRLLQLESSKVRI
ncbi:MAG: thiamine pyrophosphate-dependent enzyme [Candidatus Woesearchaeota archaeon]